MQTDRLKVTLDGLTYFSLMNFYAAHSFSTEYLRALYSFQEEDFILYSMLEKFSKIQLARDPRGYENRSVAGVSFYYNMFYQESPFLPFGTSEAARTFSSLSEILMRVVEDRIQGIEGGYVSGGFLGNKVSEMLCPVPFYFVSHQIAMKPEELYRIFLPSDFSRLGATVRAIVANSRTSNTLGGVLFGPVDGEECAEVIVLKESPYGECGWSKTYRMTVNRDGISSYTYEEVSFLTLDELASLIGETHHHDIGHEKRAINPGFEKPIYLVKRDYKLANGHDISAARLDLRIASVLNPKNLFARPRELGQRQSQIAIVEEMPL